MTTLTGKTAFITGAAAGIGKGIAEYFAHAGAQLALIDINVEGLDETRAGIGGDVEAWAVDIRDRNQLERAVHAAVGRFGKIDILVNNAGIYPRQDFLTMSEEQWDDMQDVNLKSMFYLCQLVLPAMVERRAGKIVNISSVTFLVGLKRVAHYIASKGGVIGLTRALAKEFGEHNIHINCISPGAVEVEAEKKVVTADQVAAILALQSLQRRILPQDIARAALFLSSELSDGMTGQMLNVDGGWALY
ncbi:MAG: SDR family NAD(P)-dependent oxidoreductase [Bryobacteraceae bacterium]